MQFQAACDDELRQRVFDTGQYASLTDTASFLNKMKELAVVVVHKSIPGADISSLTADESSWKTIRSFHKSWKDISLLAI